jgi:tetratricopeptide (TPR) repeat protein
MRFAAAGLLLMAAVPARAGDTPLYEPAPEWIAAPLEAGAPAAGGQGAALQVFDSQVRIEGDREWEYVDTAVHIASPEVLVTFSTITLDWIPDKGDLIVHEISLLRGGETINLLAAGTKLEVLRREKNLEKLELTGELSATATLEGVQVGDILRIRHSRTSRDAALGGNVETVAPILAKPVGLGAGRLRVIWPAEAGINWRLHASGFDAQPVRKGKQVELLVPLPAPKQPEMPDDAPVRFRHPPLLEISSFEDWADVSRTMAPLYATEGALTPELAAEAETIRSAAQAPLERAQLALQLVQDKIRYLAVGMNGGNLVPQSPAETWQLRYGDCKAKTLLLLTLLRELGIEAEPVAASLELGDFVQNRIAGVSAFDHVLVRAEIDGESLWLDGTGIGSRIEDIRDTPNFGHVLPLRQEGAGLMAVELRPNGRPDVHLTVVADESTSFDLPMIFDATAVVRGELSMAYKLAVSNLDAERRDELVKQLFTSLMGQSQFSEVSIEDDPANAATVLKARGVTGTAWSREDGKFRRDLARALDGVDFRPNRAKREWADIPVATPGPETMSYSMTIRLPDGGKGYVLEGEGGTSAAFAGRQYHRSVALRDGVLTIDEQLVATGAEIPVSAIAAERDKVSLAIASQPRVTAPDDATRRWNLGKAAAGATQKQRIAEIYDTAIAQDPDETSGYLSRASFRNGIGDFKGAREDYSKAIAISADQSTYLQRAWVNRSLGDLKAARADAAKARDIDPSSVGANSLLADILAEQGELDEAVALLDERIALGGDQRDDYLEAKAGIIGEYGDPAEALAIVNELMTRKPADPGLLNASCWIKGTRSVELDSALKECTSAIELSSSPVAALDSRSVVWLRMERYEDALRDLDAVLNREPALAQSRYMRAVVLARLGRAEESADELAIARQILPRVDAPYKRYGILP